MQKYLLITFFLIFNSSLFSQTQLGQDIIGEADSDMAGRGISLSADGNIIAFGAQWNDGNGDKSGHVRVYELIGATWSQKGLDIDGKVAGDNMRQVSLSANGDIIAVGSGSNDGNGANSGHVRIYEWNGSAWIQKGLDIYGEAAGDASGHAISLSANGNILAIGAYKNSATGADSGHVRIYEWNGSAWAQKGLDIDGEAAGDYFGYWVSLSSDGTIFAATGVWNDGNGDRSGHVRIYEWNGSDWIQKGLDIDGEAAGDQFGSSISLSSNGLIFAAGAAWNDGNGDRSGHVRIYEWNGSAWVQKGGDLDGEAADDWFGNKCSLSANGNIIAVGSNRNGANSGHVRIYEWNGSAWIQIGGDLDGGAAGDDFGSSVELSDNGSILAVGAVQFNSPTPAPGYVKAFSLPISSNSAPTNISLTSSSVNENVNTGTTIGLLSTTDSDSGDTHTYTLVSGTGDTDNASFIISSTLLLTNMALDYETKNSYSIRVRTTDVGGLTYEEAFSITVNDIDEDSDGDGITNNLDNCPSTANSDQLDTDGDGIGDVCDNAPTVSNANQLDTDGDGIGDVIDADDDGDGVADTDDAFPLDASESADTDGDGIGDNADTDLDNDGALDTVDNCLYTPNADQLDTDGDGIGNACDPDNDNDGFSDVDEITCGTDPLLASSLPADTDSDGIANCIDTDDDNDGYSDTDETTCGSDPLDATSKPLDTDSDGTPNCIDPDDDNDGYLDENDAFPLDATEWLDTDQDGTGNNSDTDDDGDGQLDTDEIACGSDPLLATSMSLDTDVDTIPDCVDTDDDNDGVLDTNDAFPLDASEWIDTDADGIGNNADTDDDNDGFTDSDELACDSDPLDRFNKPADQDNDLIPDCVDSDRDGDGYLNSEDVFPDDADEWEDTDGDGLGNNFEVDDDNDGYLDTNDAFPLDPNEWADTDNDGIGDNADPDDNNDGFDDDKLIVSGTLTPGSGGLEDTWKVINIERYSNARVRVYNKNGQEVFSALAYRNDWRGTYKDSGNLLPGGSYYYVVDPNNGEKAITGWLYITY